MNESRCSCEKCQRMCETRPCLPTPEEAARLDRTMRVDFGNGVVVTSPAIEGLEGQTVEGYRTGRCVYFADGLCSLHAKGLKPLEGRLAHHSVPWQGPREHVLSLWAGQPVRFA
jgi:hypothetical protein